MCEICDRSESLYDDVSTLSLVLLRKILTLQHTRTQREREEREKREREGKEGGRDERDRVGSERHDNEAKGGDRGERREGGEEKLWRGVVGYHGNIAHLFLACFVCEITEERTRTPTERWGEGVFSLCERVARSHTAGGVRATQERDEGCVESTRERERCVLGLQGDGVCSRLLRDLCLSLPVSLSLSPLFSLLSSLSLSDIDLLTSPSSLLSPSSLSLPPSSLSLSLSLSPSSFSLPNLLSKLKSHVILSLAPLMDARLLPLPLCALSLLCANVARELVRSLGRRTGDGRKVSEREREREKEREEERVRRLVVGNLIFRGYYLPLIETVCEERRRGREGEREREGGRKVADVIGRLVLKIASKSSFLESRCPMDDILDEISDDFDKFCDDVISIGSENAQTLADCDAIFLQSGEIAESGAMYDFLLRFGDDINSLCEKEREKEREREREFGRLLPRSLVLFHSHTAASASPLPRREGDSFVKLFERMKSEFAWEWEGRGDAATTDAGEYVRIPFFLSQLLNTHTLACAIWSLFFTFSILTLLKAHYFGL